MFDIKKRLIRVKNELRDYGYNKRCRERLKNKEFSIISHNCIGGILYHRYKMRFNSPTINLFIEARDFVLFCENLKEYVTNGRLFFVETDRKYPVADLKCDGLKDIRIFFMHYASREEAESKWYERANRVDYNNLFLICSDKGLTYGDIERYDKIACTNKVIFTAKRYPEIKCHFFLEKYKNDSCVGKYVNDINPKTGVRYIEKVFDFVSFFNNSI